MLAYIDKFLHWVETLASPAGSNEKSDYTMAKIDEAFTTGFQVMVYTYTKVDPHNVHHILVWIENKIIPV